MALVITENEPIAKYTAWRIGGPARYFANATTPDDLRAALAWAREQSVQVFVLGGGTNLLVRDAGFDGLVLRYRSQELRVEQQGEQSRAWIAAGAPMAGTVRKLAAQGWAGLQWAEGLPGTIGGAVFGNAGCYGSDIASVLTRAWLLVGTEIAEWPVERFAYGYRTSVLKESVVSGRLSVVSSPLSVVSGQLSVVSGPLSVAEPPRTTDNGQRTTDRGQLSVAEPPRTTDDGQRTTDSGQLSVAEPPRTTDNGQRTTDSDQLSVAEPPRTTDNGQRTTDRGQLSVAEPPRTTDDGPLTRIVIAAEFRIERTDPRELAAQMERTATERKGKTPWGSSCGSVFKNPPRESAGRLIEAAGLKGTRVGGAEIALKHANYIVNRGGASSDDVLQLIEIARERVFKEFGIALELEVQII